MAFSFRPRSVSGVEPLILCAFVAAAAAIRWGDLWTIPIFTDEGDEIGLALRIARDGARPLTNDDPYLGPLFNYLLAGLFWLLGPTPWLPRGLMLALGALTIVPAYLLARELSLTADASARRAVVAGSVTAGLLAVNAAHTLVISHVAWGNCVTPLLTTTAGWLLARTARLAASPYPCRGAGMQLVVAGLTFGLALQTHPSVAILLPGVGLFLLWQRWRWFGTPWPYLSVLVLLAAQFPTLLYIRRVGLSTWLDAIREKQEVYEREGALTVNELTQRLGQAVHTLGLALGGLLNDRDTALPAPWHPAALLAFALTLLALVWLVRRGQWLIPLVMLCGLLLLPIVNGKYAPMVSNTRYLAPLAVVAMAAIGAWTAQASARPPLRLLPLLGALVLLGWSAIALAGFSAQAHADGRTNTRLLASLTALEAAYQPGDLVVVDRATYRDWSLTEGRLQRVVESWLELRAIPHRVVDIDNGGRLRNDLADRGGLVVLSRRTVPAVARGYQLDEIATDAAPGASPGNGYTIGRLSRLPGERR